MDPVEHLLQCVAPEDWTRIWRTTGAYDHYRLDIDLSLVGLELLLRHLADPS